MDSKPPNIFGAGSSLRDIAISRRGGVRTRGGRLPPICMREITQVTGTKKVIAPKIPQRRAVVKKEGDRTTDRLQIKIEPNEDFRQRKNRPAKVFLQTGGTFLAEGPAARTKREPVVDVSYSIPRGSSKTKTYESDIKYDPETIKDLLDSYEANQFYEDYFGVVPPYRLPLLKKKPVSKIKSEPDDEDDVKVKIKQEITDEDSPKIKSESPDIKSSLKYFQDVKREGMLILLKIPNPSPFAKQKEENSLKDEIDKKEDEVEGCIGKLQFMRSGRMKMIVGPIELELSDTISSESYMEAASIQVTKEGGDIVIIDKIDRMMILSPILDDLLESKKEKSL